MHLISHIPEELIQIVLVTVFSLLIGLSQRKIHVIEHRDQKIFGTDRTFTFIGLFGYLMFMLNRSGAWLFMAGGVMLTAFLIIYYIHHLRNDQDYGITSILIALITYCLGPLLILQPLWFVLVVVVIVLIFSDLKSEFISFSEKIGKDEFLTLAKFLIIAGIILPMVPDTPIMEGFSLTPYKIWLAVVVVSGISYISYILRKFVLKKSSIIISGFLGGLYSSTATTIILAKKCRQEPAQMKQYIAGILFATSMMYLRVLILLLVFNKDLFLMAWPWFLLLVFWSVIAGFGVLLFRNRRIGGEDADLHPEKNPLEFTTALVFTGLFVFLSFLTYFVLQRYGTPGLDILSFVVGLVDIDPFILSLFQGKFNIPMATALIATFQAIISNNVMKMLYAMIFGSKNAAWYSLTGFLLIILLNVIIIFVI